MGLFSKIKNMFKGSHEEVEEKKVEEVVEEEDVEEDGLNPLAIDQEEPVEEVKVEKKQDKVKESVKVYEKGLTKSRQGFVSKLANLTNKYSKITDEYFDDGFPFGE